MAAQPWMKWNPQHWRSDEKLRMCSLAARGLWIEMIAIMHRAEKYGHLMIAGKAPTPGQLAVQVGAPADEVERLIQELEEACVFSRTAAGEIYSRRMTIDHKKATEARENGKRGGNPTLYKQGENDGSDKGQVKGRVKGGVNRRVERGENRGSEHAQARAKKPLVEMPQDWRPGEFGKGTDTAVILERWSPDEIEKEAAKFRDYHRARDSRFADWNAAWGTWVRNAEDYKKLTRPPSGNGSFLDTFLAEKAAKEGRPH